MTTAVAEPMPSTAATAHEGAQVVHAGLSSAAMSLGRMDGIGIAVRVHDDEVRHDWSGQARAAVAEVRAAVADARADAEAEAQPDVERREAQLRRADESLARARAQLRGLESAIAGAGEDGDPAEDERDALAAALVRLAGLETFRREAAARLQVAQRALADGVRAAEERTLRSVLGEQRAEVQAVEVDLLEAIAPLWQRAFIAGAVLEEVRGELGRRAAMRQG